jgi:hypothetical protein
MVVGREQRRSSRHALRAFRLNFGLLSTAVVGVTFIMSLTVTKTPQKMQAQQMKTPSRDIDAVSAPALNTTKLGMQ